VDTELIRLLRSLTPREWDVQTIAPLWKVRDVAAHLLDTALRKLSLARDSWFVENVEVGSAQDLIAIVDRLNREGVTVYRRLSPAVLIDAMKLACEQSADFHESLDPFAPARFPVSWAGEQASLNWFDTARELTERWHHQQQIRFALDRPGIMIPELYHPVLDTFARGLPYLYQEVDGPAGAVVVLHVSGACGGEWFIRKGLGQWDLVKGACGGIASRVTIPEDLAWRIFTKGIDRNAALGSIQIEGDRSLGKKILHLTAIVA
jgi:uncharacterized protein (TIGR03083 family)